MKLLNPGPVTMSARVKRALSFDDECHREPEFAALVGDVRRRLADVYAAEGWEAVLLGGSGTAAVEAMLALVAPNEAALVVANGVYGERIAAMLRAQQKPHEVLAAPWTEPIDVASVDRALATGAFGHAVVVHHETTTGRLNDLAAIGAVCTRHGVPLLVDAVSSFGAEALDLASWGCEAVAATANKCLHGAPGVAFVLAREEALDRPSGATSVTLDLRRHAIAQRAGGAAFTLPTHVVRALREALAELDEHGGWRRRREAYRARAARVRRVVRELGVELLLAREGDYASSLTSWRLPARRAYVDVHARLKRDGFVIYRGQGALDGEIFRIAVMGDLDDADMDRLAASLRAALG